MRLRDNIMYIKYPEIVTKEVLEDIVKNNHKITSLEPYPTIINIKDVKIATPSARQLIYNRISQKGIKACAVLVRSKFQEILYNTFLINNYTKLPTKIFSHEDKAIEWLKSF